MPPASGSTHWHVSPDVYHQRAEDQHVLIKLPGETYYTLNLMGGRIWLLIQEPLSFKDLCAILTDEFEVDPDTCRMQTRSLLDDLEAKGLARRVST